MIGTFNRGTAAKKWVKFFSNFTFALFYRTNFHYFVGSDVREWTKLIFYAMYYLLQPGKAKHDRKYFNIFPNIAVIKTYLDTKKGFLSLPKPNSTTFFTVFPLIK